MLKKENLLSNSSFDVDDIPNLINLSKDNGKVQFCLTSRPLLYEGLDYLDPIFHELKSPLMQSIPLILFVDAITYEEWKQEFFTLSKQSFENYLRGLIKEAEEADKHFESNKLYFTVVYLRLKILRMDNVIQNIRDHIHNRPNIALSILTSKNVLAHYLWDQKRRQFWFTKKRMDRRDDY
jgi:hypothetical protein